MLKFCLRKRKLQGRKNMKQNPLVLGLLLVVVFVGIMHWEVEVATAALSNEQCHEERRMGRNACKPVMYGKLPSPECCERVRVTHMECVCPKVTPKAAALFDLNRVIRLIEGCGRQVPHHFKCGSITTP